MADADLDLVARLRAGDVAAIEPLMERYGSLVHRVAYGITRNQADAEEVAQDVFLTLVRKVDTFEGRAALGTWIYRVAANAALIKRRGKRREVEVSLEDHLPTFLEDGHREGDRTFLLEATGFSPIVFEAMQALLKNGVLMLSSVTGGDRRDAHALFLLPDAGRSVGVDGFLAPALDRAAARGSRLARLGRWLA